MQIPVNKNASENAKMLLNYLSETAGKAIITGQHTQTIPMEEVDYIFSKKRFKISIENEINDFVHNSIRRNINNRGNE